MKSFVILFATFAALSTQAATKTIKGLDAEFHPFVLETLEDLQNKRGADSIPTPKSTCTADEELSAKATSLTCQLKPAALQAINLTKSNCSKIQNPRSLYAEQTPRVLEFSDMKSVPMMMKVFGLALTQTKLPEALQRKEYFELADRITLKVFAQEFETGLSKRRQALQLAKSNCSQEKLIDQALGDVDKNEQTLTALKSQWPKESNLPYPSFTRDERKMLATFLSAMTWRARGGGIYQKVPGAFATQKNRIRYIWNSYTTILQLLGANTRMTKDMSFSLYTAGFRGWHDFWDMGTNSKYTLEEDFKLMTERGEYQVAGALESVKDHQFPPQALALAGRQMGACYLFGWHGFSEPRPTWGDNLNPPFKNFSAGPTSWGELCFGMGLGLGLSETFLRP